MSRRPQRSASCRPRMPAMPCLLLFFLLGVGVVSSGADRSITGGENNATRTTADNATLVLDLGLDNFATTLASHHWTCLLLYDAWDERETYEQSLVLEGLAERYTTAWETQQQQQVEGNRTPVNLEQPTPILQSVAFGRLHGRQHAMLRDILTGATHHDDVESCPAQHYYTNHAHGQYDPTANFRVVMTPATLLDYSLGPVTWPAQIVLVGSDFNVYALWDGSQPSSKLGGISWRVAMLEQWLHQAMVGRSVEDNEDDANTTEHDEYPEPLFQSRSSLEREIREKHWADILIDNSFTWDRYDQEQRKEANVDDYGTPIVTESQTQPANRNMRLLLETDAREDLNGKSPRGYFVYRKAVVKRIKPSAVYLDVLQIMMDEYLAWVVGYEVTWSEERKARENEQTNFGVYLQTMNQQLQNLVDKLLTLSASSTTKTTTQDRRRDIPKLKGYFEELVFGSGRSAHSFQQVLTDMKDAMGATAEERRQQRLAFRGTEFPIVQPLRDYLEVLSDIERDKTRYAIVLAELTANWNNIMRQFHKNLNKYYVTQYLKNHSGKQQTFQFRTMDVLDMADTTHPNHSLLTNYDDFHAKYTATGTPVILSNVQLTPHHNVTLKSFVQDCAASDVTMNVQISEKVGQRQASNEWGGLKTYVLDDSLVTEERRQGARKRPQNTDGSVTKKSRLTKESRHTLSDSSDDENEEEEESDLCEEGSESDDGIDRSLTLKQFAILSKRIDTLYLHDFTLEDHCDYFLYNHTPYDTQQKFQIPSVIASYDLFQRLPHSSFSSSWPSLFVGKRGSNSKLHVDNGASGFFMYLASGRKRWIVYNRDERVHLYERIDAPSTYPDVLGIGKDQESDDFLSRRFPLLHRAERAYEIIQEPGQLVYIPPSCPHAVENLDDTVGLAMNLAPREGIPDHLHHQVHRAEFGVFDLAMNYLLFEDQAGQPVETKEPLYTTFGEYKSQY